ncbi:uncharacterized protein ACB058_006183 [Synchiropus picturatus]
MTAKFLLIAALAVGFTLLHGSGAVPPMDQMPAELTDEQLAELDKMLSELTTEDIIQYLKKQKEDNSKWLRDNREVIKAQVDKFVDDALASLQKETTPEEAAALEKQLSDFSVEEVKAYLAKMKTVMDKLQSLGEELAAIFPTQTP